MTYGMIKYGLLFAFPLLLVSCFEKDEAVNPYSGEVVTIENNITLYQSYFDFESGEVKAVHSIHEWQLGFESGDEGWHILVNSGDGWFIWNTRQGNIEIPDPGSEPANWNYDIQSSYPDSTAIGDWTFFQDNIRMYTNDVYILGNLSANSYTQRKRIQFFHVDNVSYQFCFIDEETEQHDTVTIFKNDSAAFTYYNLIQHEQLNLEPGSTGYDIVFCPYYDLATLFGATIPYLVRGIFLNTQGVLAVLDSVNTYQEIDYELLGEYEFSHQRDMIGYKWKDVSVNVSEGRADYSINRKYNYIIRTTEGNYYKLRFLSFSLNGEPGYPQFEYNILRPAQ